MDMRTLFSAAVVAIFLAMPARGDTFRLDLPVACTPGFDCFIQNYADVDPGPEALDHACGNMTYNGHTGTDFRIRHARDFDRGVAVLAAAPGRVLRVRDGVADNRDADLDAVPDNRACGNGMVIDHGGGWTTQYCHLRSGSVRVRPDQRVAAGAVLGQVGLSGRTEFAHLHFTVRKDGIVLDPFTRLTLEAGCGVDGAPLWNDTTALSLGYRSAAILNAGFAAERLTMADVEAGRFDDFQLTRTSPAIVFFGRAIGLFAGDVEIIEIRGPDGRVLKSHMGTPLERPRAQQFMFAGVPRPEAGWQPGRYVGLYRILRSGEIVSETAMETRIE